MIRYAQRGAPARRVPGPAERRDTVRHDVSPGDLIPPIRLGGAVTRSERSWSIWPVTLVARKPLT